MALRDHPVVHLRGLAFTSLTDTAVVESESFESDGGGGGTIAFTASGTVQARIDPLAAGEGDALVADRLSDRSTHLLTVPVGTTLDSEDRVVVAGRGTFEVTAARERTGPFQTVSFEMVRSS